MFLKKRMRVHTPIESPIICFYWKIKYAPFFHIRNDNMYMMLSVCCFWIFNKKKRCGKSWVSFCFIKMIFFLTYAWIWIPYGYITSNSSFSIIMDSINMKNSPGIVSESCHESTFKLIRHHNFNDALFSVGASWTFNKYNNIEK